MTGSVLVGAALMLLGACGGRSTIDYGIPPEGTGGTTSSGGSGATGAMGGTTGVGGASFGGSGGGLLGGSGGVGGGTGGVGGGTGGVGGGTGGVGGGTGGVGGGTGGVGGGTGGSSTGGSGGTGPLACIQCIGQQCPQVQQCIMDSACRQGAICTVQNCLSGGGGGGAQMLQCAAKCFNGNYSKAFQALQGLQCVMQQCGGQCQGGIPGLPGGGGGLPGGTGGSAP